MAFALALPSCTGGTEGPPDAGEFTTPFVDTGADDKALLYNLIGRWYPEKEIERLSDRTLTPDQWCEREPTSLFVFPDKVEVRCTKGALHSAMIAQTRQKSGMTTLTMRAREDSALRALEIKAHGPRATISGSPCFPGRSVEYGRFPEYEILSREILGGRRCAQISPKP